MAPKFVESPLKRGAAPSLGKDKFIS